MSDDLINKKEALTLLKKRSQQLVGIYGDLGGAVSGAAKLINELPTADRPQGEWIPCSERLPDDDDRVLTYDTDGDINIMWFDGRDEDGKDVWKDDYSIEWCDIVAWQPLPEPWKGADDD